MDYENLLEVCFDFFIELQGKIICYVGGVPISLFGLLMAFLCIPPVLMCILPWYDNDDDD